MWPALTQLVAQGAVVLDDPVVNDGQASGAVEVGVGVLGRRMAMGGPAGVADARTVDGGCGHAGRRILVAARQLRQVGHRTGTVGRPGPPDPPVDDERHPGRVVTPVFQLVQRAEDQREGVGLARDAKDAAHS